MTTSRIRLLLSGTIPPCIECWLSSTWLVTQPYKVPVSNSVWFCSRAGTFDFYDRWWLICHTLKLCLQKTLILWQ
jgi:hypothetical protein